MASIDWPSTLPQKFEQDGYSEDLADNTIRSEVDVGPAKVRKRYTAGVDVVSGKMHLTADQVDTLKTFYRTDTEGGSLKFNFDHPTENKTMECRFTKPPGIVPLAHEFEGNIELEILP